MKKVMMALIGLVGLNFSPAHSAEMAERASRERFYGKITAIDHSQKSVTVHNKKKNADERFRWSDETTVISEKKPIQPTELKVGQSLMISYITENDLNKAQRIMVRRPFKKAQQ